MKKHFSAEGMEPSYRIRALVFMAILAAMGMVLGKLLQIPIGNSIRISFENLPIILAGFIFGPIGGGAVALVEDTVGSLIAFGEINPIITAGAASIGVLSGILSRLLIKEDGAPAFWKCAVSVTVPHIVGSMVIKSFGLYVFYRTALPVLLMRVPVYIAISAAESVMIYTLFRSSAVRASLKPFLPGRGQMPKKSKIKD